MLTAFEDSLHLEKALEAGADGYLTKDISAKDLINSLLNVMNGERVFSKSIINIMQKTYVPSIPADTTPITISAREQEILNYLALGKTSPEIAELLNISVRTVQSHRSNIIQKLGIKSASGLIRYAVINFGPGS
jgi:DNA-binding NarL/FixJ family response regulator